MKKILAAALVVLVTGAATIAAEAPGEILIASESWEDCTNEDGTGLFWEILQSVFEPAGVKVKHQIRSYSGSVKLLEEHKVDALVGAYKDEVKNGLYPRWFFGADLVAVAFKADAAGAWEGENSLKDKKVGWIKGYSYDTYLGVPVRKFEFDRRGDAFKVLESGRIDFFMDAYGDLMDAKKDGIIPSDGYRFEKLMQLDLFIVFADTENGRKFREIFDRRFEELLKDGKIKALYSKWESAGSYYPFD